MSYGAQRGSDSSDDHGRPARDLSESSSEAPDMTSWGEAATDYVSPIGRKTPEGTANVLSHLTFWWLNALVKYGYKNTLNENDLWQLAPPDRAAALTRKFESEWDREASTNEKPSLVKVLRSAFGLKFYLAAIPKIIQDSMGFLSPLLLKWLVDWVSDPTAGSAKGIWLALALFAFPMVQTINVNQYFYMVFRVGMHVRASLVAAIYRKSLRLSAKSMQGRTVGQIVNVMSSDAQRLRDVSQFLHLTWSAPFQIVVILFLLFMTIGVSALGGLFVMICLMPITRKVTKKLTELRAGIVKQTDERVRMTNEVLQAIRVIKFYAWERQFRTKINDVRDAELELLKKRTYLNAASSFLFGMSTVLVSTATFTLFALLGNEFDAGKIFASLALFGNLSFPISFLPRVVNMVSEAKVSIGRIEEFLTLDELEGGGAAARGPGPVQDEAAVRILSGSFAWDQENQGSTLESVDFAAPRGALVLVVGSIGSGKSSLLSAILGEIPTVAGSVSVGGRVAYCAQQPWIMNATVRENITFGKPYEAERYQRVIEACALVSDFDILPGGDQTEIGEKGINLSGGQKHRVSLARAVYNDADIYLLDDPLSAVDAHVGKHLFDRCISGILDSKTRVLVTHHLQYLPNADHVVVLDNGRVTGSGTYSELLASGIDFIGLLGDGNERKDEEEEGEGEGDDGQDTAKKATAGGAKKGASKLVETEERATGSVKWAVVMAYARAFGGGVTFLLVILGYLARQGVTMFSDVWLAEWSVDPGVSSSASGGHGTGHYLPIYLLISVAAGVISFSASFLFARGGVFASRTLHASLFDTILRQPMSFFDTTPIGRIINRFTKDIDAIDNALPQTMQMMSWTVFKVSGTLILISILQPLFILPCIPILALYVYVQQYYRHTSRELKRLDSVSRSPIYAHFSETLNGAETCRAYGMSESFSRMNEAKVDRNHRAYWMTITSNRWLSVRLEFAGNSLVFATALLIVLTKGKLDPGFSGLALAYALSISGTLNWGVRMLTQTETDLNSVERVTYYSSLPQEAAAETANDPGDSWPSAGALTFDHVTMRYREDLEPALHDLTFRVQGGQKVGVIGRTGAGKSSLVLCIFRLIELSAGTIEIDGVDISSIGLTALRSSVAIIPQDPVLFSGTVRTNLDPFFEYEEEELWTALRQSHLADWIHTLPDGIDAAVVENGENFSVGQRQLICLARALLRDARLVLLDEATAACDIETDRKIQQTIRDVMNHTTILTIAHRLDTVLDYDMLLCLDKGRVIEFGTPKALANDPDSYLSSMLAETGSAEPTLRAMANGELSVFAALESGSGVDGGNAGPVVVGGNVTN